MNYLKSYKIFESKFTNDYDLSKHNFNCGDCDVYAIALHRIYNYPIYIINGYFKEDDWDEEAGYTGYDSEPAHIVVKLPNGNYMDSDGEVTEEQLKKDCAFGNKIEYIKFEEISEEEAMHVYSGEDQEEDIRRVIDYIKGQNQNISESIKVTNINKEDIKSLFVEITDYDFNIEVTYLRYKHRIEIEDYDSEYLDGFEVLLAKNIGSVSIDTIYDTIAVAEEYILDVYDKPLTSIRVWPVCTRDFYTIYELDNLRIFSDNLKKNYHNPYINQILLCFDRPKVKEPVSRMKKFFNSFKKK